MTSTVCNVSLRARGDIVVRGDALDCRLTAQDGVRLLGGSIIGGVTRARTEVEAEDIGAEHAAPTVIELSVTPVLADLRTEIEATRCDLERLETLLSGATRYNLECPTESHPAAITRVLDEQDIALGRLDALCERQLYIESHLEPARILARGTIHPGAIIAIQGIRQLINQRMSRCCLQLNATGDAIECLPLQR